MLMGPEVVIDGSDMMQGSITRRGIVNGVRHKQAFHGADEPLDAAVLPRASRIAVLQANVQQLQSMEDATFVFQVVGCRRRRMEKKKADYTALVVWQRAIDLVPTVYSLLRAFPKEETYAFADQVRRAVVSIPANIVEGQARQHRKEFLQHLSIAKGSLAELHTLLIVAQRLGYLSGETLQGIEVSLQAVGRPLAGLLNSLRR